MPPFIRPFDASMDGQCLPNFGFRSFMGSMGAVVVEAEKNQHAEEEGSDDDEDTDEEGDVSDVPVEEEANDVCEDEGGDIYERSSDMRERYEEWPSDDESSLDFDEAWRRRHYRESWMEYTYDRSEDGAERREKIHEEWMRMNKVRLKEGCQQMWTTPGLRPLAESLILDWDWFFREKMPTDARYKALFPDDPEKRSRIKDIVGEMEAVGEYSVWSLMRKDDTEDEETPGDARDECRRAFYGWLHEDLNIEKDSVHEEYKEIFSSATPIAQFEYRFLDDDGIGTSRIEEYLGKGADVFEGWAPEVTEKYKYLLPAEYLVDHLATFEWEFHDRDAGWTGIKGALRAGDDIFCGWPSEKVVRKYGHLRALLPEWARGSGDNVAKYGVFKWWSGKNRTKIHEHSDGRLCVGCGSTTQYSLSLEDGSEESKRSSEAVHDNFDEILEATLRARRTSYSANCPKGVI